MQIGTFEDVKLAELDPADRPRASRPTFPDARAYIVLIDTSHQQFVPGDDPTGDGHGRSTSARSTSAARTSAASRTRA